jgi:hypothetical protein
VSLPIGVVEGNRQFRIVKILPPEMAEFLHDFCIHQTNTSPKMMQFIEKPYILLTRWCQEPSLVGVIARSLPVAADEAISESARGKVEIASLAMTLRRKP